MNVINKMFGWKDHADRTRKLAYAITHPIAPIVVDQKDAPVQEEVYEKPAEANDYVVPIRHTNIEPELTVGSGNRLISGEYFNGGTDLGYNRMNFRWGNVGTFQISPGSHMWQVVSKYYKDNKMVPITMNFGLPPAGSLLAGAGFDYVILPQGCDEVGMAGAVQGAPMRLVKARTVDATLSPMPKSFSKVTSIRAIAVSRQRSRKKPEFKAAFTSIPSGPATWAKPTRRRRSTSPR